MKRIAQIALLIGLIMQGVLVFAAVPPTISYQGYLTDASGTPVNGTVAMTLSIYTASSGTDTLLWSETLPSVNVTNGVYSTTIGFPTPLNLSFDVPYFLGVKIGADAEMTPRTRLRSAPYAMRAASADSLASSVTSSSIVGNLNADLLDGFDSSSFMSAGADLWVNTTGDTMTGNLTAPVFLSRAAPGTAPFAVASATMVSQLNAEMVGGQTVAALDARYDARYTQGLVPARNFTLNADLYTTEYGDAGMYTSTTIGINGYPVISFIYYASTPANAKIMVVKCGDASCSSRTTVEVLGSSGWDTSITIGADGFPVISYFDPTNGDLMVTKCANDSCGGTGNTRTAVDSTGSVGRFTSIAIGTDGYPVISYYDETSQALKVAKCGNAACSSGNTLTKVTNLKLAHGTYTSLAIGADGYPVISFYDGTYRDLRVVKCGNAACSAGNTTTAVDSTDDVGEYTSIAIGTDGYPVISYYDSTNLDLKVAKCGSAACSAGNTITSVDMAPEVGRYTSIAIGTDGYPVVAYYDAEPPNMDLKAVKCGNASCSAGNTIFTLDSAGDVGQYTSIAIGADGHPFISYQDVTNGSLKSARIITRRGR